MKYSLVILSNYKYRDLWPINNHYLKNNWPEIYDDTYIITDKSDISSVGDVKVITVPSESFSERIHFSVREIEADYIVLLLDDYFLTKKINNDKINYIVEFMIKNKVDYVRVFKVPRQKKKKMEPNSELYKIDLNINYAVNLQPGIWRKEALLNISEGNMNPWEFEVSMRKKSIKKGYNCYATLGNELPFEHGLLRGKYFRKTYKKVKNDELLTNNRKQLTRFEEFKYKSKVRMSHMIPQKAKSIFKKVLKKFGFKFYTE
jgi:hypothetical protein